MYNRILSNTIQKWANRQKVLIITGARQVGKTTLLENWVKESGKEHIYFNAEESSTKKLFEDLSLAKLRTIIGKMKLLYLTKHNKSKILENA